MIFTGNSLANVATNSHIHFSSFARRGTVLNFSVKKTFRHFPDKPFATAVVVINIIPKLHVAIVDTGRLLACLAEVRLDWCSLQSQCLSVNAFWKGLIGILKMSNPKSWVFGMNIKSDIRRVHPGTEVLDKDFL